MPNLPDDLWYLDGIGSNQNHTPQFGAPKKGKLIYNSNT